MGLQVAKFLCEFAHDITLMSLALSPPSPALVLLLGVLVGLLGLWDIPGVLGLGAYWHAYPSDQAIPLGFLLLAIGLAFLYTGVLTGRRVLGIRQKIGGAAGVFVFATWSLSAIVVVFFFDLLHSEGALVPSPVSSVTYSAAGITFIAIFVSIALRNRHRVRVGFISAFVGTVFGVMIFELPFLFIISPQIGLPVDRALFSESPLFCLVFASSSLLFLSPLAKVSKNTLFSAGAVFIALSSWAFITNFSFPSDPTSFVLNSASKVLGFVTAFTLFTHKAA
jgi:hypothetical protein